MIAGRAWAFLAAVTLAGLSPGPAVVGQAGRTAPSRAAFRVIDIQSGRTVAASRDDLLRTPVLPGSILKIATLVAALESGVIGPDTRMLCSRHAVVAGHHVTCVHPDARRPIGPAEALALSCNSYFASVAGRLRRQALDSALGQLGLPPTPQAAPIAAAALGLEGARIAPEQLLSAFVRLTSGSMRLRGETRRVLVEGLHGAAEYGTAAVLGERGFSALAKTGTAPMPGGGYEGLVVAVTPAERPTRAVVAMAPGGSGLDAVRLAADALEAAPRPRRQPAVGQPTTLRIGTARTGGGYDVTTIPIEEYVGRVVGAEAAASSGVEARKALAIVVRTFALRNRGRHEREGFDLCDLTHCQVMGRKTQAGDEAARATEGQALYFGGELANVFYTASCGGHSERASDAWPGMENAPYLRALADPECREDSAWVSDVAAGDLQRALVASGRRGQVLRGLEVVARSGSGRVTRVRLDGFEPPETTGEEFRLAVDRLLGWQVLKSTLFDVERTGTGYRFRGSGRGHGVGLCVVGSARMAAGRESAAAILARYFPGADVRSVAPVDAPRPPVRLDISVPSGEERELGRIEAIGQAAVAEFAAKTGEPPPVRVQLVFHATVEAYSRASGKPWWTMAATRETRVDLIPVSALRGRRLLEQALRHELAHVMTERRLSGRSIWVREAVAMDLAGDQRVAAPAFGSPAACPTDAEWLSMRSADALQEGYRRAAACFSAQRARGRRWDEIR